MFSLRNHKHVLFGGMGFAGGVFGALVAEQTSFQNVGGSVIRLVGGTSIWGAVFASGILLGLTWALEVYAGHKRPSGKKMWDAFVSGLLAGAIAAGIAQAVFMAHQFTGFGRFFFQSGCWGLAGAILGWRLSRAIPNLGAGRAALAGMIGGTIGGMGFIVMSALFTEVIGRALGIGILGAALGLAMVIVEALCREASLEVIWGPKEITFISLGPRPISIGGGDDNVYVHKLPARYVTVQLIEGKIYYTDGVTGKIRELHDGNRIKIGNLEMVVHGKS